MIALDDPQTYDTLDPQGMGRHLARLPQQCRLAYQKALDFPLTASFFAVRRAVISGMGGSAIGGDLVQSLAELEGRRVDVYRDYALPFPMGAATLFVASSYSGMTEETLSAFRQALDSPAQKLAITTGGKLKEVAEANGVPVFPIEYEAPPRAAIAHSFFSLLGLLQKMGLLGDKREDIVETVKMLEKLYGQLGPESPLARNPAKQLATRLAGHVVVIYGAGLLAPVARRWKTQINENSKTWAFYDVFPELNHNSVLGYRFPAELAPRVFVVMLRSNSVHPRIMARYGVTGEVLDKAGVAHQTVDGEGASPLSQMMSLLYLGDYVSYFLAVLQHTDPTPVDAIDYLKKRLREL